MNAAKVQKTYGRTARDIATISADTLRDNLSAVDASSNDIVDALELLKLEIDELISAAKDEPDYDSGDCQCYDCREST